MKFTEQDTTVRIICMTASCHCESDTLCKHDDEGGHGTRNVI